MRYGRSLRALWELVPDGVFLNHGSFGACPKEILAEQGRIRRRMEAEPDAFFRDDIMPRDEPGALRAAAGRLAAFVNARESQVVFIENATVGIQAVLRSVSFRAGDRILITDHTYNAVRLMVEARCAETGAVPLVVTIPLPCDAGSIVASFAEALTAPVKLAIVDHITSPSALVFPLARIIPLLRENGAQVLIDGAHGLGQIPLDLEALRADWYVSNAHKWLYAPKGTAFLYASDEVAGGTRPNVVSHYIGLGFPRAFDFTGTRDNSGWLCTPAAIDFVERLEPAGARAHEKELLEKSTKLLSELDIRPVAPIESCAAMRSFVLPGSLEATREDAAEFMRALWERERVQIGSHAHAGSLLLRVSAQVYVDDADLDRLRAALEREGWPGRV